MMLPLIAYQSAQGNVPVKEWLRSLEKEVRQEIGAALNVIQSYWPICNKKPLVGSFGKGLYEARVKVQEIQYRVIFCILDKSIILLHGFIKKTQKTPQRDLDLAQIRYREVVEEQKRRRHS